MGQIWGVLYFIGGLGCKNWYRGQFWRLGAQKNPHFWGPKLKSGFVVFFRLGPKIKILERIYTRRWQVNPKSGKFITIPGFQEQWRLLSSLFAFLENPKEVGDGNFSCHVFSWFVLLQCRDLLVPFLQHGATRVVRAGVTLALAGVTLALDRH